MNISDQAHDPKLRAKVTSSVLLGRGDVPGCVCIQILPKRSGFETPIHQLVEEVGDGRVVEADAGQ
jgi:hypothetical protein